MSSFDIQNNCLWLNYSDVFICFENNTKFVIQYKGKDNINLYNNNNNSICVFVQDNIRNNSYRRFGFIADNHLNNKITIIKLPDIGVHTRNKMLRLIN